MKSGDFVPAFISLSKNLSRSVNAFRFLLSDKRNYRLVAPLLMFSLFLASPKIPPSAEPPEPMGCGGSAPATLRKAQQNANKALKGFGLGAD